MVNYKLKTTTTFFLYYLHNVSKVFLASFPFQTKQKVFKNVFLLYSNVETV